MGSPPNKGASAALTEITSEMIEAGASVVASHLQLYDVDSPSLCANIAEDVLRVGFGVLLKEGVKI